MKKELTLKEFRSKGGKSTKKKYGREHYSAIGKKGMESRWKKKQQI